MLEIEFVALNKDLKEFLPPPDTAFLPDWLHYLPRYLNKEEEVLEKGYIPSTIKKSQPVLDIIEAGYYIPLPCDVWVDNYGENSISFQWSLESIHLVSQNKADTHKGLPIPPGYYAHSFKWLNPWIVRTPPGYSSLFIHPSYHTHLPFLCSSSIVDTDLYPTPVNFSFFLKHGFDGLIAQGTPMIQVIPFKRDSFKSVISHDEGKYKNLWNKAKTVFFDRYKRFFHSPKTFL
jgi:hypothetical protein